MQHFQTFPAVALAATLLLAGCAGISPRDGNVTHVVICWLKDPGNAEHRTRLIKASEAMKDLPGVLNVKAGVALKSDRKMADSSFDVAIVMTFAGRKALQDYLDNPRHKKAQSEILAPLTSRVVIYDLE